MYMMMLILPISVIIILILFDKLSRLTRRISQLEKDIQEIRTGQTHVARGQEATSIASPGSIGSPIPDKPTQFTSDRPKPSQVPDSRTNLNGQIPTTPTAAATSKREPSRTQQEWEQLIGGKLLNRIGALALIIGIGFFLKYAFDNNWISESVRVVIGVLIGLGTLALGMKTHKKGVQIFAQGLFGAGIAILYLSVYASFNYYHLLPQIGAFLAMAAVTTVALYLASRYESRAIAFLGWGGGFLTPFLLSSDTTNTPGLFGYLVALNLGLLTVIVRKKALDILAPFSIVATALVFFYWKGNFFQPDDILLAIGFLSVVWIEYTSYLVVCQLRKFPNNNSGYLAASFNTVMLFTGLLVIIDSRGWMAIASAVAGITYLGLYLATYKLIINEKITQAIYLLSAIALAAASILIGFKNFDVIIGWSLEGIILIWCGLFWKRRIVTQAAFVILAAAGFGLLTIIRAFLYEPIGSFTLLLNDRALTFAIYAAALGGSAFILKRYKDNRDDLPRLILQTICSVVIFWLLTVETLDYFRHLMSAAPERNTVEILQFHRNMLLPSIWIILSLPFLWFGMVRKSAPVAIISFGISILATLYLVGTGKSYEPIEYYSLVFNFRVMATLIMLGVILIQGRILVAHKLAYPWTSSILNASRIAIVLLGLFLITVEAWDIFERSLALNGAAAYSNGFEYSRLINLQQLTLSGVWLFYSVVTMALGLWRKRRSIRIISICLFGISIIKIFTYDLSFLDSLYRIFSFVGLGVILLAVSYGYQRYKDVIFGSTNESSQ
jgi:uncharacterized membrane protein